MTAEQREFVRRARDQRIRSVVRDPVSEKRARLRAAMAHGSPINREDHLNLVLRMLRNPGKRPRVGQDGRVWLVAA